MPLVSVYGILLCNIYLYIEIEISYSLSHWSSFLCSKVQLSKFYGLDWKQCHRTPSEGRKLNGHRQEILTHKNITLPAKIVYLRTVTWMKMDIICTVEWIFRPGCSSLSKCRISIVCIQNLKHRPATAPCCHLRFDKLSKLLHCISYIYYPLVKLTFCYIRDLYLLGGCTVKIYAY